MGNAGFGGAAPNGASGNRGQNTRGNNSERSRNTSSSQAPQIMVLPGTSRSSNPRDIARRIAEARASGQIPQNSRAIPIRLPNRGSSRTSFAGFGEALIDHIEQAQLEYALALSREDFEREPQGAPPTDQSILKMLKEVCLDLADIEEGNEHCSICCEEQHAGDLGVKLPCVHAFHKHCIMPWLEKHNTCPVCRLELNDYFQKEKVKEEERKRERLEAKRLKHEEEITEQKKKLEELSKQEENEMKSKPINQWPVSFLKKILKELGLEEQSQTALEKDTLIELISDAKNQEKLAELTEDELKRRLGALNVPFEDNQSKDGLVQLLAASVTQVTSAS